MNVMKVLMLDSCHHNIIDKNLLYRQFLTLKSVYLHHIRAYNIKSNQTLVNQV